MERVTIQTQSGGFIDIVSDKKHVTNRYYILRDEVKQFSRRAKELGAPPMSKGAMKILLSEDLVHSI